MSGITLYLDQSMSLLYYYWNLCIYSFAFPLQTRQTTEIPKQKEGGEVENEGCGGRVATRLGVSRPGPLMCWETAERGMNVNGGQGRCCGLRVCVCQGAKTVSFLATMWFLSQQIGSSD